MAISKVVYKSSASATPVTWMDATPATALAADIMSPKTAMLADGVLTTGTGSGGGGGLVYETGTFTPTTDIERPSISFSNSHSGLAIYVNMIDISETTATTDSGVVFSLINWYSMYGTSLPASGLVRYGLVNYLYKTSSNANTGTAYISSLDSSGTTTLSNFLTQTGFSPYAGSTSRYFRSGRTYKWIAVWAPTT